MTNTASLRRAPAPALTLVSPQVLSRENGASLVEQIVRSIEARIDDKVLRTGARMPSIRMFADTHGVSRFTVVEAYDRLVASGYLESRRGSGFFVKERPSAVLPPRPAEQEAAARPCIDVVWLVRAMFRQRAEHKVPGSGLLPNEWMDGELIAGGLRAVSRQHRNLLLQYGHPQGLPPLRQQLQLKLAELEIAATPDQIVTTTGVTQGLDLVARHFLAPGDTVFVDDPAWFLMFGSFSLLGAKVIGIPRQPDGPDIPRLAELAAIHKPKLFVINSVLHNPTSSSLSASKAFQVLKIAEQHDFTIVEDDIYCDMHPGSAVQPATRLAALDQLQRVIYLSGFSKTLAANLRVGFIATSPELAIQLSDRKMLSTLTTSEIGERVVHKILSEGHYRKHADRLRARLDGQRDKAVRQFERIGLKIPSAPPAGMFVWADCGRDTGPVTERGIEQGILCAPGALFSPSQLPSTMMRLNVATSTDAAVLRFLERELADS